MAGVEEMTRRRDAWRERAEVAAAEIKALRLMNERAGDALGTERRRCALLTDQLAAARAESRANLAWVRKLQKDVEDWKLNSKTLAQMYIRQGRIVAWLGPISQCPSRHGEPRSCLRDCADRCGVGANECFEHEHCDMCGAIRCHGFWWRRRFEDVMPR